MTITAEELAKLDKAATQGEWDASRYGTSAHRTSDEPSIFVALAHYSHNPVANTALIVATVNALRSGTLIHVDEVERIIRGIEPANRRWINRADLLVSIAALGDSQ